MRRMSSGLRDKREFLAGLVAMMLIVCRGSCGGENGVGGGEKDLRNKLLELAGERVLTLENGISFISPYTW